MRTTQSKDTLDVQKERSPASRRPLFVAVLSILLAVGAAGALVGGIVLGQRAGAGPLQTVLAALIVACIGQALAWGLWRRQNWACTGVILLLGGGLAFFSITVLFDVTAQIFAGEVIIPIGDILESLARGAFRIVVGGAVPAGLIYGLIHYGPSFQDNAGQRTLIDRIVRYLLLATALSSILIVCLIILFTMMEAWTSIEQIGLPAMLLGTIWRPGSIIGTSDAQFGLAPMMIGSVLSTFGAVVLGVPLSLGTAILLAEIAPQAVREIVRPAIELLAGIPSVVYGLFGMVVLAPLIRRLQIPYNTGFGLLNASIVLAVMIIPTVTNIAEDAIRAVPRVYKEGSLALGATRWQTVWSVQLPAARSGIIAAIILGIGRALGETMALIMVIGNAIAMPAPLNGNPLSIVLSAARTLTGNIAVEINYASGVHKSSLFFTGVMLLIMILAVNMAARYLMKERLAQ